MDFKKNRKLAKKTVKHAIRNLQAKDATFNLSKDEIRMFRDVLDAYTWYTDGHADAEGFRSLIKDEFYRTCYPTMPEPDKEFGYLERYLDNDASHEVGEYGAQVMMEHYKPIIDEICAMFGDSTEPETKKVLSMPKLNFFNSDFEKINACLYENKDVLHYDALYDMGLLDVTINAIWTGYWRSYVDDFASATAHAGAYIALNAPELITTKIDSDTDADYMAVLSNMVLYCEGLDLSISRTRE